MKPTINEVIETIDKSAFNRNYDKVDLPLLTIFHSLALYTHLDQEITPDQIFEAVPDFQRDNTAWSQEMQVKFIENILKGCSTQLILFKIGTSYENPYQILDGLQRLTAIHAFVTGKITVFGGFTFDELRKGNVIKYTHMISVRMYHFKEKNEAIRFYIEMNENITHSPQDIDKAKQLIE